MDLILSILESIYSQVYYFGVIVEIITHIYDMINIAEVYLGV